jgi:hypothetical protein
MSPSIAIFLTFCICLFGLVTAEVIVSDQFGNLVGLPLTGGNATGGYTVTGSAVRTSPYLLSVFISDITLSGEPGPESESFYIFNGFGNASLVSQSYQSGTVIGGTVVLTGPVVFGNYLGNQSNPTTGIGAYIFTFSIPVGQHLTFNMTYNNTQNPAVVDKIFISVDNPVLIVGDPQFIGLRGQSYQVHGIDGAVYNLISEPNSQVNSRFLFLSEGKCPIINGVADSNCWSHPGSYLGEISYQQIVDGKPHAALITAGPAKKGFAAVQMDGRALKIGDKVTFGTFSVSFVSAYRVTISMEHFAFSLSNSDMFINQAVSATVPLDELTSHGLLGQTHSTKVYATATRYLEGNVDDYIIADDDIFGDDFVYNQYQQ